MPTYDYRCEKCGHSFELFQKMSDARLKACPKCGGEVRRLIGPGAAVIFKGSGFYSTDYRDSRPSCGREKPRCGRATPCETEPCNE
jgi:putative FmdB family regulatory protein